MADESKEKLYNLRAGIILGGIFLDKKAGGNRDLHTRKDELDSEFWREVADWIEKYEIHSDSELEWGEDVGTEIAD